MLKPIRFCISLSLTAFFIVILFSVLGNAQGASIGTYLTENFSNLTSFNTQLSDARGGIAATQAVSANLTIAQVVYSRPVVVGSKLTYTVIITNNGPAAATEVIMTDTLPSGVTVNDILPNQGVCNEFHNFFTCNLDDLDSGLDTFVTIVVTPVRAGTMYNRVTVGSNETDPDLGDNEAVVKTLSTNFHYSHFGSSDGLNFVGDATLNHNRLRLTPALNDQAGAAWHTTTQFIQDGFATEFQFQVTITNSGGGGADGFAFVIQDVNTSTLGDIASGIGYNGITKSLAIEFDTWYDIGDGESNDNHISVHTRGTEPNSVNHAYSLSSTLGVPDLSDGVTHTARIVYIPGQLRILLDATPVLTVSIDLATKLNLDDGRAWVGFTATTGGNWEEHDILEWWFSSFEPTLALKKIANPSQRVAVGEVITYTITVTNTGNTTATKVMLNDTIPENTMLIDYEMYIGTMKSAWPMFHQNVQHTGRSPHYGPLTNSLRCSFPTTASITSSPAIAKDGTVYFGSYDHQIYALTPDCIEVWNYPTGDAIASSPAIDADGTIYIGSNDDYLYAINPEGSLKWRYLTGGNVDTAPTIGGDGTIYFGSDDDYFYALNADGTLKWRLLTGGDILSSPALSANEGIIYFTIYRTSNHVYAVTSRGNVKWITTTQVNTGDLIASPAIASSGEIYVSHSADHGFYALHPDGTTKWRYQSDATISSPAIGKDDTIYLGSYVNFLHALEPVSGTQVWKVSTAGRADASPAIDAIGNIYIGSDGGAMQAYDSEGALIWSRTIGGDVNSSPAIGSDGTLYFGCDDGTFYAIGPGKVGELETPLTLALSDLPPSDVRIFTVTVRVSDTLPNNTIITNTAKVFNSGFDSIASDAITHTVYTPTAPSHLTINGLTSGLVNNSYAFTATVGPITTTTPITYQWQIGSAANRQAITNTGGLSDTAVISWTTAGTYIITTTAKNAAGAVSAMHIVTVAQSITDVNLSQLTSGTIYTDTAVHFSVDLIPDDADKPYTYTVDYDDGVFLTQLASSEDPLFLTHTFLTPGIHNVQISVWNASIERSVTDTTPVTVVEKLLPPTSLELSGRAKGKAGTAYAFTATVSPVTATKPFTYQWKTGGLDDQRTIIHTGGISDTVMLSWMMAGTYIITATANNKRGTVTDTYTFQVLENLPPIISHLTITPSSPMSDDNLGVDYDYSDPENDPPVNTRIRWTRDGQLQSAFNNQKEISSSVTYNCEIWCVAVTPHDGYSYGSTVKQCVNVGGCNTPPQALNVAIDPADPSAPAGETVILPVPQGITVTYKFTDTDGDLEDEPRAQTRWYRNEKLQPVFNDQESVSLDEIHPGEIWHAEVRVHDGHSYGDFVASESVIVANADTGNHMPEIITGSIRPVAPEANATLVLSYTYRDEDGDDEEASLIRWYRNDKVQPGYNGAITIPAESTLPGDAWYAAIRPHDGRDYGVAFETNIVQIYESAVNTEPEIIEAHITPAEPGDDDCLRLHYTYRDVDGDPEGDTLILWYKVGLEDVKLQEDYIGLTVIPSTTTKNGETWFAKVVPHDGHEYGLVVAAHSVVVGEEESNIPPRARNVYLTPERPSDQDRLELNYEFVDANGDSEEATVISWILNGYPGGYEGRTIIPAYATAVGQSWCATVTPHDGEDSGELVESNCVTITEEFQNAPPEAQNPYIIPGRPGSNQNLTLGYTYFDPDGDDMGDSEILWYRNNVPQKNFEGQTSVPADSTNPGEQWYATIRPHDGKEYGALTTTTVISINHPPEIIEVKILPQAPNESDTLTVTYTYSDVDDDLEDWPSVQWYCNGEPQPDYDGIRVLPARATSVGEVWYAKVSAFDGIEYSSRLASSVISIARDPRRFIYLPAIMRDYPLSSLTLTRPIGNESWQGGSSQAIRWETTGNVPNVSLSYSTDGFFTSSTIVQGIPNRGSYVWAVPNISTPCVKVRIVSPDAPRKIRDTSGCVELLAGPPVSPVITLTNPTGGENWVMDRQHKITWDHAGDVPRVNLTYSTDDFVTEEVIASEVPNTGSYQWRLPINPTASAKVRITSADNSSVQDTSNFFVIGCDESWEDNDEQMRACPLNFGTTYRAAPDDVDDWYYVFLGQTASLHVLVNDYHARGQLVVYPYNADRIPPRGDPLANDARARTTMELPNDVQPHALDHLKGQPVGSGLPPGRYFIRIYTSSDYDIEQFYGLVTNYNVIEP